MKVESCYIGKTREWQVGGLWQSSIVVSPGGRVSMAPGWPGESGSWAVLVHLVYIGSVSGGLELIKLL